MVVIAAAPDKSIVQSRRKIGSAIRIQTRLDRRPRREWWRPDDGAVGERSGGESEHRANDYQLVIERAHAAVAVNIQAACGKCRTGRHRDAAAPPKNDKI